MLLYAILGQRSALNKMRNLNDKTFGYFKYFTYLRGKLEGMISLNIFV